MLTSFIVYAHTNEGVICSKVSEEESKSKSVKRKKKVLFRDRGNLLYFSSSLPWSCIFFLSERRHRGNLLLSPARLSPPSCLVCPHQKFIMIHSLQTCSLLLSCQTSSEEGYSGLFPLPAFHRVNQEPKGSPFVGAPSSQDEAGIHPFYWSSNTSLAWLGWSPMLSLVQVHSHTKDGGQVNHPTSRACPNFS